MRYRRSCQYLDEHYDAGDNDRCYCGAPKKHNRIIDRCLSQCEHFKEKGDTDSEQAAKDIAEFKKLDKWIDECQKVSVESMLRRCNRGRSE